MVFAPIGRITTGIQPNTLVMRTIDFLCQRLPEWRDDDRPLDESENRLTAQLPKFLNRHAESFQFYTQEPQRGSFSVDLSVTPYDDYYKCFFYIECKRLPTPSPKGREREYVTGGEGKRSGGIQRFKLGLHGPEHNIAAIIGYVQNESCEFWYETINSWIDDLIAGIALDGSVWCDGENLTQYTEDTRGIARCESLHPRNNSDDIRIIHLWINMRHKS